MTRIDFEEHVDGTGHAGAIWTCAICGRGRVCPYAVPSSGDPVEACWSCGDLLARIVGETALLQPITIAECRC